MSNFIVVIPSYKRSIEICKKSLKTLSEGGVKASRIYIFVANRNEEKTYGNTLEKKTYHKIVVGVPGIQRQRIYISKYFPNGKHIVSIDDDVEAVLKLKGDKLIQIKNLPKLFTENFNLLKKLKLYIWGVYPVRNTLFMSNTITTDLRFIIGTMYGYINRKNPKLYPKTKVKEDYETSILYYLMDGGVLRFNNITIKTKFMVKGGCGDDKEGKRTKMNETAANYLVKKYPNLVKRRDRKNGMPEVRLLNK